MREHAKVDRSTGNAQAFFLSVDLGIQHIFFSKIWQIPIELWREKTIYMHSADCHSILLLLAQEGGSCSLTGIFL